MRKLDSNLTLVILLAIAGSLFILSQLLSTPLSDTWLIASFVILFLVMVIFHGWKTLGPREVLVFFVVSFSIPLLYEATDALGFGGLVGCTCIYSDVLGPKFLGKVPFLIPLGWSLFIYCTVTMTNIVFNRLRFSQTTNDTINRRWFIRVVGMGIITGFMMASLDLIIDPVMVALGAWSWPGGGVYYGIPIWNYEGWVEIPTVTFIVYNIYLQLVKRNQVYIGREKRSRYTLFVLLPYLAAFIIFVVYAMEEHLISVILWSAVPVGFFSIFVVLRFYRFSTKKGMGVFP